MDYVQTKYENKTWLPLGVVRDSFEEKWERSLVFFVQLRTLYTKPIVYNFTYKKISMLLNISIGTVKKHIDILKSKNLVSVNNKNLCLKGTTALKKLYTGVLVPVKLSDNKKDQLTLLRYIVIKRNLRLQEKACRKALDIINYHKGRLKGLTGKGVKSLLKREEAMKAKTGLSVEKGLRTDFLLSNVKIGGLCNRGIHTGLKIQAEFNRLGLIESSSNYRFIPSTKAISRKDFFHLQEYSGKFTSGAYSLSGKGNIYKRLPNKITIKA